MLNCDTVGLAGGWDPEGGPPRLLPRLERVTRLNSVWSVADPTGPVQPVRWRPEITWTWFTQRALAVSVVFTRFGPSPLSLRQRMRTLCAWDCADS